MEKCLKCEDDSCPFAFTEQSEYALNAGCLPCPMDIIYMRVIKNQTWECHSRKGVACTGAIKWLKEHGLDQYTKVINLTGLDDNWSYAPSDFFEELKKIKEFKPFGNLDSNNINKLTL